MNKIKAGVVGATGYAGIELVRLLLSHPSAEVTSVSSVSFEGQKIADIYPNLKGVCDLGLESAGDIAKKCDVVFASLPHGLSEPLAEMCLSDGAVFIDLGADFRLRDEAVYNKWYGKTYNMPDAHEKAVYGLPELEGCREKIKTADIIGNPGCYPTSAALALMPALKNRLIAESPIIIDAKSGVTGAGRALTQNTHFPDTNEAFSAYKAGAHRHTPEIEQTLSDIAGSEIRITFVPHLLPVNRGIESTVYCRTSAAFAEICDAYKAAYENEYFVRLEPAGSYANIKNVRLSNFCDISLHYDAHTETLIVCSCIDNMVKGAAGQAIQNMNIRFGLDEREGLLAVPAAF